MCKTLITRKFEYAVASLSNSHPVEIRATDNVNRFKLLLKTHLLKLIYNIF